MMDAVEYNYQVDQLILQHEQELHNDQDFAQLHEEIRICLDQYLYAMAVNSNQIMQLNCELQLLGLQQQQQRAIENF